MIKSYMSSVRTRNFSSPEKIDKDGKMEGINTHILGSTRRRRNTMVPAGFRTVGREREEGREGKTASRLCDDFPRDLLPGWRYPPTAICPARADTTVLLSVSLDRLK